MAVRRPECLAAVTVNRINFAFLILRERGDGVARPLFFRYVDINRDDDRSLSFVLECEAIGQSLIHWLNQLVNGDQRRPALRTLLNRKPGHKGDLTACGKVPHAAKYRMQRGAGCSEAPDAARCRMRQPLGLLCDACTIY
jgi:hypothetical protein